MTHPHDPDAAGVRSGRVGPDGSRGTTERRPGQWPVARSTDEPEPQRPTFNRARTTLTIGAIRGHLEEQPSPNAVRACARHWCAEITQLAEAVITAQNTTETRE